MNPILIPVKYPNAIPSLTYQILNSIYALTFFVKRDLTLVFALTVCYTGLRARLGRPCAQVMVKSDEPRYQQKKDSYQQK